MKRPKIYPRYITDLLWEALKDSPAVLIHGSRQCGKTTLAHIVKQQKKYDYINFDDPMVYNAASEDPIGFVENLPKKVILDEIQKAPFLFSMLKKAIDSHRLPGRFILTGSANILHLPKLADSLAGRMQILHLYPLSQEEITQSSSSFLDNLFKGRFKVQKIKKTKVSIIDRIVSGGYPAVLTRPVGRRRANWYHSYITTLIQRDMLDLARLRSVDILPRLLTLSANQTAGLINFTNLANAFQVSRQTISEYMALLEHIFLLEKLPPWYANISKRLIKTPKLHFSDTGLVTTIRGLTRTHLQKNRLWFGNLMETFVFQEIKRQASYHKTVHNFFYYRDKKGTEVDIIIERGLKIAGVEVKSSLTVNASDFKGLLKIQKMAGSQFAGGVVIYNGSVSMRFGKGLYAIPVDFLWKQ